MLGGLGLQLKLCRGCNLALAMSLEPLGFRKAGA